MKRTGYINNIQAEFFRADQAKTGYKAKCIFKKNHGKLLRFHMKVQIANTIKAIPNSQP